MPGTLHSIALLRAVAALWVVAAHCMIWGGWYGLPLPSAKFAVDLFMMVSGFLMVVQARQEPAWRFWLRRFFRLAPAYYLSLALAAVSAPLFLAGYRYLRLLSPARWVGDTIYDPQRISYSLENLLSHVTFVFGLSPEGSFSSMLPDWSLSLEMQFYAAFPLLLLALNRGGVAAVAALALVSVELAGWVSVKFYEPSLLVFGLPFFLAGMVAARPGLLNAAVAMWLAWLADPSWVPAGLIVALLGLREVERRVPSFCSGRLIAFGSDCSYGVYLFHGFFISAWGLALRDHEALAGLLPVQRVALMLVTVIPLSYAAAWLVFRHVEKPGIALGRLMAKPR